MSVGPSQKSLSRVREILAATGDGTLSTAIYAFAVELDRLAAPRYKPNRGERPETVAMETADRLARRMGGRFAPHATEPARDDQSQRPPRGAFETAAKERIRWLSAQLASVNQAANLVSPDATKGCANCHGMFGDLAPGRDPEELCDTCYDHVVSATTARAGTEPLAQDVINLVIAGREAWELLQSLAVQDPEVAALDKALEAFASRVPYADEPEGGWLAEPTRDESEAWKPINTMQVWEAGAVTDGERVAASQKCRADDGSFYFAIDPEDGLDWEPTHWMPLPTAPAQDGGQQA